MVKCGLCWGELQITKKNELQCFTPFESFPEQIKEEISEIRQIEDKRKAFLQREEKDIKYVKMDA